MEIVKNSAKDCYPAVQKTTLVIMERLQQVLQMEVRHRRRAEEGSVVYCQIRKSHFLSMDTERLYLTA